MERFKDLREDTDFYQNAWDAINLSDEELEKMLSDAEATEAENPSEETPVESPKTPDVDYISSARSMLDNEEAKEKEKAEIAAKKKADKEKQKVYDDAYKQAQKDLERKWQFKKRGVITAVSPSGKTLYVRRVWTDNNKPYYIIGDETDGSRDAYYTRHKTLQHGKAMSELLAKIPLIKYDRDHSIHELLKQESWCGWDGEAKEGVFDTREAFYLKGKASEPQLLEFLARAAAGDLRPEYFDKDLVDIDTICHVMTNVAANKTLETVSDYLSKETTSLLFIGYLQGLFTNDSGNAYNDDLSEEAVYEELLDCCIGGKVRVIAPTATTSYWKKLTHSLTPSKNKMNVVVASADDSYIINEVQKLKDMHFDTIIANPPYEYGNEITRAVLDNVDFDNYINLMPMSAYKKNGLYKHIVASTALPANAFKDAAVQAHVVVLSKEAKEMSKEEAAILSYREDLQDFYRENLKRERTYQYNGYSNTFSKSSEEVINIYRSQGVTPERSVMFTWRTCQDGVHTGKAYDKEWNLDETLTLETLKTGRMKNAKNPYYGSYDFINFKSHEEKKNFCDYWYRANLSNKILKGLHKESGTWEPAIPRVDWSRPWTDEQILRDYGYKPSEIKKILEN